MTTQYPCAHHIHRTIWTGPYFGPVSRDENRAAHGGVCHTEECRACGARRSANANWNHREEGPWGPSREERRQHADRLTRRSAEIVGAIPPVTLTSGAHIVRVSIDPEGMLALSGEQGTTFDGRDERAIVASLPRTFLLRAQDARRSVLAAQEAAADV